MSGGQYRLEIASTSRAGCQNGECKQKGIKIQKGELRFGTFVTIQEHQTWRWKHWQALDSVVLFVLEHVKASTEGNYDYLDGFEELPEHEKVRVREAFEEGHIADDDWTGDPEMNRPGMNGYRTPASKKKMKEEKEEREIAEGIASPSKSDAKKRSRAKHEANGENDDNGQPAPKKAKSTKRSRKVKTEDDEENRDDDDVRPKTKGRQKATKIKAELEVTGEEDDEVKPRNRKRRVNKEEINDDPSSSRKKKNSVSSRKAASRNVKREDSKVEGSVDATRSDGDGGAADIEDRNEQDEGSAHELPQPKKGQAKGAKAAPKKPQEIKAVQPSKASKKKEGRTSKKTS